MFQVLLENKMMNVTSNISYLQLMTTLLINKILIY